MKLISSGKIQLLFLPMLLLAANSFSQAKNYVGANATVELIYGSVVIPGGGITIERQFTKHSGIESGIYYRSHLRDWYAQTATDLFTYSVAERYISIPLLYKYYSSFVNFSVGPSVDYFAGWKQKTGSAGLNVNDYSVSPAISVGVLAKVSKRIYLNDRFLLEPEVRFNPIISTESAYVGIGIAAKVRL
jgi:hypothetical protein